MKFISSVGQDISQVSKVIEQVRYPVQHKKLYHISKHSCIILFIIYKKIVLLPHKNRAVYSNVFHDNRHVRLSILLVAEKSIKHSIYFI